MAERVGDERSWWAWSRQVEHTGWCQRPVRVRGSAAAVDTITGEVLAEFSTAGQPDGALLLACKDRRAAVCPACAETYRRDTWHVIASGLRGRDAIDGAGGGVPATVAGHPVVLATLTAPSFGHVHRTTTNGPCRAPGSGRPVCPHRVARSCPVRHSPGDVRVGLPLCWDCYDYTGHILWHGAVPELWRRTSIYLYRALARLASTRLGHHITVRAVRDLVRVSYVKVAEYQKRAAVHLHVIMRLDGVDLDDSARVVAPPDWADTALLEAALREAATRVAVPLPDVGWQARTARWGTQLDVSPVNDPQRAAAYLAKYATKTAGDILQGLPARRFSSRDLGHLRRRGASPHVMLLVHACMQLARHPGCAEYRFGDYPHTLGFRGHFATKSRRYSVTLTALRAARKAWRATRPTTDTTTSTGSTGSTASGVRNAVRDVWAAATSHPTTRPDGTDHGAGATVIVSDWRYLGTGWARPGDADLAATLAREHAAARDAADIATTHTTHPTPTPAPVGR